MKALVFSAAEDEVEPSSWKVLPGLALTWTMSAPRLRVHILTHGNFDSHHFISFLPVSI
jgi:hypothetical protein